MSRPKHITTVEYSSKACAFWEWEWESGVGACEGQSSFQGECLALGPPSSEEVSVRSQSPLPWAAYSHMECQPFLMLI